MKEGSTPFQLSDWPFWRSSGKEGEICGPPICMTMHMPPRLSLSPSVYLRRTTPSSKICSLFWRSQQVYICTLYSDLLNLQNSSTIQGRYLLSSVSLQRLKLIYLKPPFINGMTHDTVSTYRSSIFFFLKRHNFFSFRFFLKKRLNFFYLHLFFNHF